MSGRVRALTEFWINVALYNDSTSRIRAAASRPGVHTTCRPGPLSFDPIRRASAPFTKSLSVRATVPYFWPVASASSPIVVSFRSTRTLNTAN